MQKTVFLSVGGEADATFAKEVHALLGDRLSYHYQITGAENVKIRTEIEGQIQGCRIFVAFWSYAYLHSVHAKNELALFRKLVESGGKSDKELIVVPLVTGEPDIQSRWKNPITSIEEFVLGRWREVRAVDAGADAKRISELVLRKLANLKGISEALVPRGWLVDQFKTAIAQPNYQTRELLFISGLEGIGRRTALRQYMLQTFPGRIERPVFLDSIDGPEDLLIPLMDAASMPVARRKEVLTQISNEQTTATKEARKILHEARTGKSYYVITVDRFAGVDAGSIPIWLTEALSVFKSGSSPLIFIITSNPVSTQFLEHYPHAAVIRVPGLEEEEMGELVHRLSLEEEHPTRWSAEKREAIVKACGGNPSLCKSVMHALSYESTLDFADQIAKRADENFGQVLASLMAHWVKHYSDRKSDLLALRVIEKIGVTSKDALDEIMQPVVDLHGVYDLFGLRNQGLVEQLSDGLYRIPPLVQRRLGSALWTIRADLNIDSLFEVFSKSVQVAKTEYGAMYASNVITASLRSNTQHIAPEYDAYVTLSMLFKAGYERYSNKEFRLAHTTLQRAMQRLLSKSALVDVTTQIEIARYAGLAAVRRKDSDAVDIACHFLNHQFEKSKRSNSAKAMAYFIRGFEARISNQHTSALTAYESALHSLHSERFVERQRAAIYTELATVHLRAIPPNYTKALDFAKKAFEQKDVTHTLSAYIHALIAYVFESDSLRTLSQIQPYINEIENLLTRLEIRSKELSQDFHVTRNHEYRIAHENWELRHPEAITARTRGALTANQVFEPQDLEFL